MTQQHGEQSPAGPAQAVAGLMDRLPGSSGAKQVADGVFGAVGRAVGAVPSRTRRVVVYTGAGALAVAGIVEWPFAAAVAAVTWLTQARPAGEGTPENAAATTRTPVTTTTKTPATTRPKTVAAAKSRSTRAKASSVDGGTNRGGGGRGRGGSGRSGSAPTKRGAAR